MLMFVFPNFPVLIPTDINTYSAMMAVCQPISFSLNGAAKWVYLPRATGNSIGIMDLKATLLVQ